MISNKNTIEDREQENLIHREEMCKGNVRPTFFMEEADAMEDDWFEAEISDHDIMASTPNPRVLMKNFRLEHTEAFALQRDVNHRYAQHARIMAYGYHKKFRAHALPGYFSVVANWKPSILLDIIEPTVISSQQT